MTKIIPQPANVEIDFTDAALVGTGGWSLLAKMAQQTELLRSLSQAVHLKVRRRGASDAEMLWSLIASLAAGHGALSDLDALRVNPAGQVLLGLSEAPSGRRLGEYLSRFGRDEVTALRGVVQALAQQVAPAIIDHHVTTQGYVPVFIDGTAIEVDGHLFEGAGKGYNGEPQLWLHNVFLGGLWASGLLHPGGVDVAKGWQTQLADDVTPLLPEGTPVWLRADNAYYRGDLVRFCTDKGWDYSISVTNDNNRRPVLRQLEGLPESAWSDIGRGESATLVLHRPSGWKTQHYVVVRQLYDGPQQRLTPAYTVILVSRDDLPVDELVRRHRGKQGQENAFKGPLIEMDLHHPPCRRFAANQAFYACGQIAQLLLMAMQYQWLPEPARKHGLRPLIRYLMRSVARLVKTGRRYRLDFAKNNFRLDWLLCAALQLE